MVRSQVLIISHDVIGLQMAGPGIRYWELSRALARHFPVTLAVPGKPNLSAPNVRLQAYLPNQWQSLSPVVEQATAILACGDTLAQFPMLEKCRVPLIIDGYDPHPLETLELFAGTPEQEQRHQDRERILQLQCRAGDFFICASERQRDWWLGLLEASGRINTRTHADDPSLRRLIDIVPFGLPASPPQHTKQVLKGVWPGIGPEDKVALWGGGLWQWLDPLSTIRAMAQVRLQRADAKLVFPGTRHPNQIVPIMPMYQAAVQLAQDLGLLNQCVFLGEWAPFEDWPNYLLEADIGLSLHFDTLETHFAFRTRMLDYIWAGLPMVVTEGDTTSELVTRYDLGQVVPPQDIEAIADAIVQLLDTPDLREIYRARFEQVWPDFTWEKVCEPLARFCRQPRFAPDRAAGLTTIASGDAAALAERDAEIARLHELVAGYERGRFIRLMKWLHGWQ